MYAGLKIHQSRSEHREYKQQQNKFIRDRY